MDCCLHVIWLSGWLISGCLNELSTQHAPLTRDGRKMSHLDECSQATLSLLPLLRCKCDSICVHVHAPLGLAVHGCNLCPTQEFQVLLSWWSSLDLHEFSISVFSVNYLLVLRANPVFSVVHKYISMSVNQKHQKLKLPGHRENLSASEWFQGTPEQFPKSGTIRISLWSWTFAPGSLEVGPGICIWKHLRGFWLGQASTGPGLTSWGPSLQSPVGCWMGPTLFRDSHEMAHCFLGPTNLTHMHVHAHRHTLTLYHPEFFQISYVSFHTLFYFSTLKISRKSLGCILCIYSYTNIGIVDSCYSQESCSRKSPRTLK